MTSDILSGLNIEHLLDRSEHHIDCFMHVSPSRRSNFIYLDPPFLFDLGQFPRQRFLVIAIDIVYLGGAFLECILSDVLGLLSGLDQGIL